jgi:hypothetical protein
MTNFISVLRQLQLERNRLASQLQQLNNAISALSGTGRTHHGISAAGRARISAAQRARWANVKGPKVVSIAAPKRRTMSPAARRKIAAAQKLRWGKWKRAQKRG